VGRGLRDQYLDTIYEKEPILDTHTQPPVHLKKNPLEVMGLKLVYTAGYLYAELFKETLKNTVIVIFYY
jgi:hypothetical protein